MQVIDLNKKPNLYQEEMRHFKLKKLEMQAEEDCLQYKITSPFLRKGNHTVNAKDGILEIAIMIEDVLTVPKGKSSVKKRFSRTFFSLPKPDFNTITSVKLEGQCLHFTVIKDIGMAYDEIMTESKKAIA